MNTNKPKPPRKLLSETVVELKTDFPTAVERLQALSGCGIETDNANKHFYFESNRKGKFHIYESNGSRYDFNTRTTGMRGGLYVEEGKTKAVVYTYRLSGTVLLLVVTILLGLVMLGSYSVYAYTLMQEKLFAGALTGFVLILLLGISFPVFAITSYEKGRRGGADDAEKMQREALRRLSAVDDWEK